MKKRRKRKHKQKHLSKEYKKRLRFYQNSMRKNPTPHELKFKKILTDYFENSDLKNPFTFQRQCHDTKNKKAYIVDFFLKHHKIIFEVDGKHHKLNKKQRKYDKERDKFLLSKGYMVYRIENKMVDDRESTIDFLIDVLGD